MSLSSRIPHSWLNFMAKRLSRSRRARAVVTELMVDKYSYALPVRPRRTSMAADYPTWNGLVDRRYSGRHIGRCPETDLPVEPPMDEHLELFVRKEFKAAKDTSFLFAMFAQWFTDGFLRTKWEEEGKKTFRFNESNHEIDLCQIYGQGEEQTHLLRAKDSRHRGRLKWQEIDGEVLPAPLFKKNAEGEWDLRQEYAFRAPTLEDPGSPGLYTQANFKRVFPDNAPSKRELAFAVGLEHGNSTIGQVVMNTIFLREHNRTADLIAKGHPDWDDERVFQTARNVTIVVLLHIVISDYITHIAPIDFQLEVTPGMAERKRWYRTNWIPVEFALLYRWHDLIPDKLVVDGEELAAPKFRDATGFIQKHGLSAVINAAARQPAGRIGLGNTHRFLATDTEGVNVKRLSLQMARTCGLPGFNAYRKHCGLKPYEDFLSLTRNQETAAMLERLYGSIDKLDWFTGLYAEEYDAADMMGELMVTIVGNDAFTQALTNPLLSKALYSPETFSKEGMEIIETTRRLSQVIARNASVPLFEGDSFRIQSS